MDLILDALSYPVRRGNRQSLVLGGAMFCLPPVIFLLLPNLPYVGMIGFIVYAFVLCYMMIFFHAVMLSATKGSDRLEWPEVTDAQSMAGEVFRILIPLIVAFLPLIGLWIHWTLSDATLGEIRRPNLILVGAAALLGLIYLPMALLVYSFYGEIAVVKFWAVGAAIGRVPADYFKVVALLAGLFVVHAGAGALMLRWPLWLSVPLLAAVLYYTMVAGMRGTGMLYHRNRIRLGWEPPPTEA